MTVVGSVELPVIPLAGTFAADLIKITTAGARDAGKVAGLEFTKQFAATLSSTGLGNLGTAIFGKLDVAAAQAGIASGKSYSSGFTEAVRVNGQTAAVLGTDAKGVAAATEAGIVTGRAYTSGIAAGTTEGSVAQALRGVEAAAAGSGDRAAKSFVGSFTTGLGKLGTGVALAVAAVTFESIKWATEFDKEMELLHTQAGASQAEVESLKGSVLSLAGTVGQGPTKLAEALFHIESDGYRGAQALDILKIAAEGASTGNASLDETTYALVSTMKALGDTGLQGAIKDMGILNAIVGAGDLRFGDLNKAISTGILGTIQTFHISLTSLGGALDYLTQRGEPAQQSATRLAMGIALLAAPSKAAAGILRDLGLTNNDLATSSSAAAQALAKSGVTTTKFAQDLRQPNGIGVAIQDLNTHLREAGLTADESAATISRAFGGGRTGKAIQQMAVDTAGISEAFNQVTANADKFQGDFAATTQTLSFKWHSFVASLQADAIDLGHGLEPVVSGIFTGFDMLGKALEPVKTGFGDVWQAAGKLQTALVPLEHVLETVFGVAIVGIIDAVGFALRDVVTPAVNGVAAAFQFLDRNKAVVIGLATVIGISLVPAILVATQALVALTASAVIDGLAAIASGIKTAAVAAYEFALANPILAGMALVVGGLAAAFVLADENTRTYTVDVQALTAAVTDLTNTGNEKPLAVTLLDDLSKWKPTSGSTDAISYFQKYGLAASTLVADLANPGNAKGVTDFLTNLSAIGTSLDPNKIGKGVDAYSHLKDQISSTNPAVADLAKLFYNLTQPGTGVAPATIQGLATHFLTLEQTITNTATATAAHAAAVKQLNAEFNPDLIKLESNNTESLATAQKNVADASKLVVQSQKDYVTASTPVDKALNSQISFFQGVANASTVTAATLLKNAQDSVTAFLNESTNIAKLSGEGVRPDLLAGLVAQGPQYVAAAASLSLQAVQKYGALEVQAIGAKEQDKLAIIKATEPQLYAEMVIAAAAKKQAVIDAYGATLRATFQPIATQLLGLATFTGQGIPENVAQAVLDNKFRVISALDQGMTQPQKNAIAALQTLATTGGATMQQNLANAIANHTPLVVSKAEALKLGINAQIEAILSTWGITVSVDDKATATLQQIATEAQKLVDLNPGGASAGLIANATAGGKGGFQQADGGIYHQGVPGGVVQWAEAGGESFIPHDPAKRDRSVSIWHETGKILGVTPMADGGVTGSTRVTINEDSVVNRLAGLATAASAGASGAAAGSIGGGVAQWVPDILRAMSLLGLPMALLPRIEAQMTLESGGNPNAINNSDSNAAIGQNSRGLMQTVPGTFAAYAGPFAGAGIYDPFANIYAGLNYAMHRYAGDPNIGLGYGHGYDSGGMLPVGAHLAVNSSGLPEPVLTAAQWKTIETLVAQIAKIGVSFVEKTTTGDITAGGKALATAVKEGNGPLQQTVERQLRVAQGQLYAAGVSAVANGNVSPGEFLTVQARAKQVTDLTAQLVKLNTVNTSLLDGLKTFAAAQQQFRDSLTTSISSGAGFTDLLKLSGSPSELQSTISGQMAQLTTFTSKIKLLKAKGYSDVIIRDVAQDGIQNGTLYADMLLSATGSQAAAITSAYGALSAGQLGASNAITSLTEGKIPGVTQPNATNYVNTAIFTTTGGNVDLLLNKAEFAQRTGVKKFDSGGYLYPGHVGQNTSSSRERVLNPGETQAYENGTSGGARIGKVENHYHGVDLATAHAQSNRDLALALTAARVGG